MPGQSTIARIWRGRTRREVADQYEAYLLAEGIPAARTTTELRQFFSTPAR